MNIGIISILIAIDLGKKLQIGTNNHKKFLERNSEFYLS